MKVVKFAVAVYKSEINLVLILWIAEFDSYKSLFFTAKKRRGKYIVILVVEYLDSWIMEDKFRFFGIHNYSNYLGVNFNRIISVCRITPQNYAIR